MTMKISRPQRLLDLRYTEQFFYIWNIFLFYFEIAFLQPSNVVFFSILINHIWNKKKSLKHMDSRCTILLHLLLITLLVAWLDGFEPILCLKYFNCMYHFKCTLPVFRPHFLCHLIDYISLNFGSISWWTRFPSWTSRAIVLICHPERQECFW